MEAEEITNTIKRLGVKQAAQQSGPIKAYSEQWYEKNRPKYNFDDSKKIVDPQIVQVMCQQIEIEKGINDKLNESFRAPMTRQLSPQKKSNRNADRLFLTPTKSKSRTRKGKEAESPPDEKELNPLTLSIEQVKEIDLLVSK